MEMLACTRVRIYMYMYKSADIHVHYIRGEGSGKQFVRSTEVVHFSECPLSEVSLYMYNT